MKKSIVALAILAFLIAMPLSLAKENSTEYCIDTNHLGSNNSWTLDGSTHSFTQTIYCPYGCDTDSGRCSPSTWQKNMGVLGAPDIGLLPAFAVILLLVFSVVYILKKR